MYFLVIEPETSQEGSMSAVVPENKIKKLLDPLKKFYFEVEKLKIKIC